MAIVGDTMPVGVCAANGDTCAIKTDGQQWHDTSVAGWQIYYAVYVLSCTFSCVAFLTAFKALIHSPKGWWSSLSANAYIIYLVHYIFVVWCQYALLNLAAPAFIKFIITVVVA